MENINKLMSVITALNSIEVKGKANLMNLGGCIAVLEEICQNMRMPKENISENKKE